MIARLSNPRIWIPLKLLFWAASAFLLLKAGPAWMENAAPTPAVAAYAGSEGAPGSDAQAESGMEMASAADATPRLTGIEIDTELDLPHWLRPGEFAWNDEGVPAGQVIVVVNIRARVLSVYRGGIEIGRSSLIYGADDKPTPTGTFPILQKNADHVSNLYDAPMPHMLRLTWDGVAIHGSAELRDDLATRGCVGLPREFAALLFDVVKLGDKVVVWDGLTSLRAEL